MGDAEQTSSLIPLFLMVRLWIADLKNPDFWTSFTFFQVDRGNASENVSSALRSSREEGQDV
jgi:hypothetical protein